MTDGPAGPLAGSTGRPRSASAPPAKDGKAAFAGKVAVVTGGASGIGAASVRRLAADGAHVIVADVAADGARDLAREVGGDAASLDVADAGAWDALVTRCQDDHGGIDFAHLNAGIVTSNEPSESFLDVSLDRYRTVMGVNLDGVVLGVRALAPAIARRGGGAIVATASTAGLGPWDDDPIYSASKHGVVGFIRSVAHQLARQNVRVHAVCPGGVATPLVDALHPDRYEVLRHTMLTPEDVAEAVVRLLQSESTGHIESIVYGRGAQEYQFRGVPGPRIDDAP